MHVRDGERNVGVIQGSLGELQAKLQYESGKRASFGGELQAVEKRCPSALPSRRSGLTDCRNPVDMCPWRGFTCVSQGLQSGQTACLELRCLV